MSSASARRFAAWLAWVLAFARLGRLTACRRDNGGRGPPAPAAPRPPRGVPPDLAGRVLARVGDRTITLGDYVAVLDGMDRIERARYQTPDRREQLLKEIVDVELLARE